MHEPCVYPLSPLQPQSLIRCISVDNKQARKRVASPLHQGSCTLLIGKSSRMHYYHQQQAECVYKDVALSSFGLFTSVITYCSKLPPFAVLLTVWLSRITVEGCILRPLLVRTCFTNSALIRSSVPSSLHAPKYQYTMRQEGNS